MIILIPRSTIEKLKKLSKYKCWPIIQQSD